MSLRTVVLVIGSGALLGLTLACASRSNSLGALQTELWQARLDAERSQVRAAELEARLARVESAVDKSTDRRADDQRILLERMDRLVALAEARAEAAADPRLTFERGLVTAHASAESSEAGPARTLSSRDASATAAPPRCGTGDPARDLRELVQRIHGQPGRWHGPLTREQERAIIELLKRPRTIDAIDPWEAGFR